MDIIVSSNFERLLFHLAFETDTYGAVAADGEADGGAHARKTMAGQILAGWMKDLKEHSQVQVNPEVVHAARREFVAERVSDAETLETIRKTFDSTETSPYIIDPHTAVGLTAAHRLSGARATDPSHPLHIHQICLATAHPAKFSSAVTEALKTFPNFNFERDVLPPEMKGLMERPRKVIDVAGIDPKLTKDVIEREVAKLYGSEGTGVKSQPTASV